MESREEPFLIQLMKQGAQKPGSHNVVPPGRPYFVAHIPDPIEFEDMRKQFYDIMLNLTHQESMAWCRGFGYSHSTYLMRRYQHRKPKLEEVIITIGWYDIGKPVERKNHTSVAAFDRLLAGLREYNTSGSSASGLSTGPDTEYPL